MSDLRDGECRLLSVKSGTFLTLTLHDYEEEFRFTVSSVSDGPTAMTLPCSLSRSDVRLLYECLDKYFGRRGPSVQYAKPEVRQWAVSKVMEKVENFDSTTVVEDMERWANRLISFVGCGHMKFDANE